VGNRHFSLGWLAGRLTDWLAGWSQKQRHSTACVDINIFVEEAKAATLEKVHHHLIHITSIE